MIVAPEQLQQARHYVAQHKNINWYSDPYKLDESAIVEGVLNYGTWEDFMTIFTLFGPATFKEIFGDITDAKRTRQNLRPQTINYFSKYLQKHA